MSDKRLRQDWIAQTAQRHGEKRNRRAPTAGQWLVLALLVTGIVLGTACGPARPTDAPTVVVVATIPTQALPTATRPAETVTLAPTHTPSPTPTAAPTDTPSPLPPTDTPAVPTATSTALPSDTPLPTDTSLPPSDTPAPPTRTPAPPTATVPPPPQFPWRGQVAGTFSNCALTRLMGLTLDRNGGIAGDIWVHFWADGWEGAWARSTWAVNEGYPGLDDSSNWDGVLATYAKAGAWHVCIVPTEGSWDCISTQVTAQTVETPCTPDSGGVQIVRIVFQQN